MGIEMYVRTLRRPNYLNDDSFISVFDSWGKVQSGLFDGNDFNFGHFTECINYRFDNKRGDNGIIQGQYCLVGFGATPDTSRTEDNIPDGFDWREM